MSVVLFRSHILLLCCDCTTNVDGMHKQSLSILSSEQSVFRLIFLEKHKLFVTLDILLKMRSHIQQGEPVTNCCHAYIEAAGLSGDSYKSSCPQG